MVNHPIMSASLEIFSKYFLALLLALLLIPYLASCNYIMQHNLKSDFSVFYGSAKKIAQHDYTHLYEKQPVHPYQLARSKEQATENYSVNLAANLNSPIFNGLLSPLGHLKYSDSFLIFALISTLFVCYGLILIYKTYYQKKPLSLLLLSLAFCAYLPNFQNFSAGQLSFILLGLTLAGWYYGRRQYDIQAGCLLGIAFAFKYFIGLFLITFLLAKRWKLVASLLGTFLVLHGLSAWLLGFTAWHDYFHTLQAIDWYASNWNGSFWGWITRITDPSFFSALAHPPALLHLSYLSFSVCGLALLAGLCSTSMNKNPDHWDQAYALTLILMLLLSPLGWTYYFTLLLLPWLLIIRFILLRNYPPIPTFLSCVSLFLATYPEPYVRIKIQGITVLQALGTYSLYCYALLLLCGLLCYVYAQTIAQHVPTKPPSRITKIEWPMLLLLGLASAPGINAMFTTTLIFR